MATDLLRKLLAESGYAVSFRSDVWMECFASYESEHWRGRGTDEDDALEDVLRQMFPSALARHVLARHPGAVSPPTANASAGEEAHEDARLPAVASYANGTPPATAPLALGAGAASSVDGTAAVTPTVEREDPGAPGPEPASAVDRSAAVEDVPSAVVDEPAHGSSASCTPRGNGTPGTGRSGRLLAAAKTDRGLVRKRNEDACLVVAERGLVAVADGLGAQAGGDLASTMVIETLHRAFEAKTALSPVRNKALPMVLAAVQRANTEIHEAGQRDPGLRGMGTTVAVVLVVGRQAVLAHVGDSRIYRLRRGVLELLTTDHSLTNQRIRSGEAKRSERNVVTRALGGHPTVEVDTAVVTSQPGDVLLLCTDGLHGAVAHEELSDLLELHADPEAAVELLVARANAHGGVDNITAAVVRWER